MRSPPLQLESSPCSLQLDKAPMQQQRQLEINEEKKKKTKLAKPEDSDCS